MFCVFRDIESDVERANPRRWNTKKLSLTGDEIENRLDETLEKAGHGKLGQYCYGCDNITCDSITEIFMNILLLCVWAKIKKIGKQDLVKSNCIETNLI